MPEKEQNLCQLTLLQTRLESQVADRVHQELSFYPGTGLLQGFLEPLTPFYIQRQFDFAITRTMH